MLIVNIKWMDLGNPWDLFIELQLSNMTSHESEFDDKVEWNARNEVIFIRLCHEHMKKGDLQTSTFNKRIWKLIEEELWKESSKRFLVAQLKSKFNRLRKNFVNFQISLLIRDLVGILLQTL